MILKTMRLAAVAAALVTAIACSAFAGESAQLDGGDGVAATAVSAPGENGANVPSDAVLAQRDAAGGSTGSVLPALGRAARSAGAAWLEPRARVSESLFRTGLSAVQLPSMPDMQQSVSRWGPTLFGENRWSGWKSAWDEGGPQRRSDFIRQNGRMNALLFSGRMRQPQPASFYYDNLFRPRVMRAFNRFGAGN